MQASEMDDLQRASQKIQDAAEQMFLEGAPKPGDASAPAASPTPEKLDFTVRMPNRAQRRLEAKTRRRAKAHA